ncbi:unnamed protein product [Clonostachys solani]|uniref:Uncharacterized protein n=1 Tax=Clonostachys solani TaxID=160281 RepID=A0A9N9ZFN8_9HYPO|nr:unnamed protein product [Clonostachys solani]
MVEPGGLHLHRSLDRPVVPPSMASHALESLIGAGPGQQREEADDRWAGKLHSFIAHAQES